MKIKNVILAIIVIAGISFITWHARKAVELKQDQKQAKEKAINDSIILLNRLWMYEYQRFQLTMDNLDSISKCNGTLIFTNKDKKTFELRLIEK